MLSYILQAQDHKFLPYHTEKAALVVNIPVLAWTRPIALLLKIAQAVILETFF